jgi:hypothetical protein
MTLKGGLVLTLPLCLVLVFGCEKGNPNAAATVTGKVTYKGEPVTAGVVTFNPKKEGPVSSATLNADGTYSITEAPAGDFTITVDTESLNPDRKAPAYGPPGAGAGGGSSPPPPGVAAAPSSAGKYVKIPKKYSDPESSPLKATLGAGKQVKDFSLEN